jgi:hypothetical protein
LEGEDLLQPLSGQSQEGLEIFVTEIMLFPSGLDFDEPSGSGHDDIHIDLGIAVFRVIQIEDGLVFEQSDADGGDRGAEWIRGHFSGKLQALDGAAEGKAGARDGGGAGAAIGRKHIAIDPNAAGPESSKIGNGAETPAQEPLDFR